MASRSTARFDPIGALRLTGRVLALVLTTLALVPLHYLWRLLGRSSPWPRRYLGAAAWIAGARRRIVGAPMARDVVFLSNHVSWIDIPLLGGASGAAFVAKDGIADWPLIGWLSSLNRTIFIARGERMAVGAQVDQLREAMARVRAIVIFPEGTTGPGDALLPFKPSLLAALEPAPPGMMVQPVLIDYGAAASEVAWVGDESAPDNARRMLSRRGGLPVTVHFLDPFDPAALSGRKAIAAEAQRRIAHALDASLQPLRAV